jgi:hypothetical protein
MKHRIPILIAAALLLLGGSAWYFWPKLAPTPVPPPIVEAPSPAPAPALPAGPSHPLPAADAGLPALPELAAADAPLAAALLALPGARGLGALLVPETLLRRFVATVDNLPRHHLAAEQRPLKATPGAFLTVGDDLAGSADARNAERYAPALRVLQAIDPNALYRLYRQWYPLLQQAYQGLGYPDGYFNDRLVAALDDLLAAPVPAVPPALKRPNVLWVYADEDLEARSAGQRLVMRVPPAQAQQLRTRLQALRALLVSGPPPASGAGKGLG